MCPKWRVAIFIMVAKAEYKKTFKYAMVNNNQYHLCDGGKATNKYIASGSITHM